VVRDWSGGKRLLFCCDPLEEDFDTSRLCREFVVVDLRSSSLASQVNEEQKKAAATSRHGIPQRASRECAWGLVFIF
jgi:hypothetical protein